MFKSKYQDLAEKVGLSAEEVQKLLAYDNLLKKHYKKEELVEVELRLESDTIDTLKNIKKTLKVSRSAIIGVAAINYLEKLNGQDGDRRLENKSARRKKSKSKATKRKRKATNKRK